MMNKVSHVRSWKVVSALEKMHRAEGRASGVLWSSFYSLFKWRALQDRPTEKVAIEQRLEEIEGVCVPGGGNCSGVLRGCFWIV